MKESRKTFLIEVVVPFIVGLVIYLLSNSLFSLFSITFMFIVISLSILLIALVTDILAFHWKEYDAKGILLLLLLASFSTSIQSSVIKEEGIIAALSILLILSAYLILCDVIEQAKSHLDEVDETKFLGKLFLCAIYAYIFSAITIPLYKFIFGSIGQEDYWYTPVLTAFLVWAIVKSKKLFKKKK